MLSLIGGGKAASVSNLILDQAARAEMDRQARISTAWGRYWGTGYPSPLQKHSRLDPDGRDNTVVNLSRKTVDISAFYLFGKGVEFSVDDGNTEEGEGADRSALEKAEAWLCDCWDAQDGGKAQLLLEFATGAGVAGDGFLRVMLPDKSMGETFPRLLDLDAGNVTAICDPQDYKRVRQYKIQTNAIDPDTSKPIVYRTLITRVANGWETEEQVSRGDNARFETVSGPDRWPFVWCPLFHTKNRLAPQSFYGASDLECDVLGLNDAINFVISNISRILRAHGHPFQYIAGQRVGEVDRAVGELLYLPNKEAEVKSVEMLSDLASSFEQLKALREAYHELTSIPEVVSGKMENLGQLSGLALQILYGPLVQMTEVKRTLYGHMLTQLNLALLEMGGFKGIKTVNLQWPTLVPTDRQQEAATALALQQAGVSKETALTELGYDADAESEKSADEAATAAEQAMQNFDRGKTGPGVYGNPGGAGGSAGGGA